MAEEEARAGGDHFLLARDTSPTIVPPQERKDKPSTSKSARSLTPRGQRFSKLSDAYLNITSRLGSNKAARQPSDHSRSNPAGPELSPVASLRLAKSQDELQTPSSAMVMRAFMNKNCRASLDSIDILGVPSRVPSRMGCADDSDPSLSKQIDHELSKLNTQCHDTSSSTIKRIVAQYDGRTSSLKAEYDNTREYRAKGEFPLSQPPRDSLPDSPPMDMHPASNVRQSEYDSPVPDSSITDSQHLLDAEAQAHELEEARRALVPLPLNIQTRHGRDTSRQHHYDAPNDNDARMVYEGEPHTTDPFADEHYKKYLQTSMRRDISQELGRLSSYAGQFYSSNIDDHRPLPEVPTQAKFSNHPSFPTVSTGEKTVRHIKVVIGRDSRTSMNSQERYDAQDDAKCDRRDMLSEDGDWVTEATSDAGFGRSTSTLPEPPLTEGFKKAGSSLADYSDDGLEDMLDRFGSRERIIQHPAGDEQCKLYDIRRTKESRFSALLSRRQKIFPEKSGRRWASTTQEETGQFRPHILPKNKEPYQEVDTIRAKSSGRLIFDFDDNAPPRYEFRDSVSEYEPAVASTKANCGMYQYDTNRSLPSPMSDIGEDNHLPTTDDHFNRSADLDADRDPSKSFSRQNKAYQATIHTQDPELSIYAVDNTDQLEEINRDFAAASSYYDQPSANSVRSKFNFELLPLDLAQKKNKLQRSNGETNETESAAARLKRKHSLRSIEAVTPTLEPPPKAFFTSPDLSINFTPLNWVTHPLDPEDTPTPFAMGRYESTISSGSRKYRKVSFLGAADNSSFSTQSVRRRLWYDSVDSYPVPARNHPYKLHPGFVAPDDYVSDRAATIRQSCFYLLAVLSVLPFVGVLVLGGAFSEGLKWATQGEVDRLNYRQRRFIKWMLFVEVVLYTGGVVTVVVYFVVKNRA
ncbi:hypothetical protein F5Y12DRAFT_790014 [Xylaria sp. FL1777]|nr:hypothetical protein F5Y12DRAFT_790014 [Xylaria sp. FL1777]